MVERSRQAPAPAPAGTAPPSPAERWRSFLLFAAIAAGAAIFRLLPLGLEPRAHGALAVGLFMIVCWMTQVLDHGIAGILGCFLFWMFGIVKFETAFSGFADTSPWFLFGAVCFGLMGSKSGLARRLAYLIMRAIGYSYPRLLLGLIVSNFLLTAVVPSGIARVVIMAAIAMGLVEAFGVDRGSNIARGMFIILVYQATIFDKMLIAGASSITARGAIEKFGHVEVLWSQWFLAYLPCDLLVMVVAWRLALWLYPPEIASLPGGAQFLRRELRAMGSWSALEVKAAVLMLIAVGLWMTDFLHHIPAPMIGMGIGLVAIVPVLGVLDTRDVRTINFLPIFFVAAAVSLSNVLVQTKALDVITGALFEWMKPHITGTWVSTMVLYWSAFLYHIVIGNEIAMLSTSLPILMAYAREHGINPLALGMIWTFGAGPKVFIYESAVLVVGYSYGYFSNKDMLKIGAILSVVTAIILLLLVPLYWPLIGIGR
jgi:solute carrier family 13 (sodium-dependent dicarboxylate transporter), member 2/3/5